MLAADDLGLSGRVIDGRFRVDKVIGRGDLSVVYKGTDELDGSAIAIKCLAPPPGMDASLVAMFLESFKVGSETHRRLAGGCPHIAPIFETGSTFATKISTEVPYFVREWFDGTSLGHELLMRRAEEKTGRSLRAAIQLLDPVAEALSYAHAHGVVHERVNPQNFLLTAKGLKVLDFGTARALYPTARDGEGTGLLAISAALLAYAAPEQIDAALGELGPPTDVYGLALLVLEVLRDRPALSGVSGSDIVPRILDPNVRPVPKGLGMTVGAEAEAVLARAVRLEPAGRQRTAREFWEALKESVVGTTSVPVVQPAAARIRHEPAPSASRVRQAQRPHERDSMEGEPLRKAVGPLLPPTPTPFTQQPSIIIAAEPPLESRPRVPPPPIPRQAAPTIRVPRASAPTIMLERLEFLADVPRPTSPWRYVVAVVATAAIVVSVAVGGRVLLAWRAEAAFAVPTEPVRVVTPSTNAGAPPSGAASAEPDVTPDAKPFDREAARAVLDALAPALADCKVPKARPVHVKVTFSPDGTASALAQQPYQGTPQGVCVVGHYKDVRLAPFKGAAVTLVYPFPPLVH